MRWPPPDDWPNVAWSRQVLSPPHRWHVQEAGSGETLILLHGTGGSCHSFRDLLPDLARSYHVVAVDLPGQGFTRLGARHRSGLAHVSHDLATLVRDQGWSPRALVGHSAGAAVALALLEHLPGAPMIIGLNPALSNFDGLAGIMFPAMAKLLALSPFSAAMFATSSGRYDTVRQLIRGTGSDLPREGIELYRRLVANREHVDGTLLMMAQWSLDALRRDLPNVTSDCLFIAGQNDRAVPSSTSDAAAARMQNASVHHLADLGHLVHEEDPELIASLIRDAVSAPSALAPTERAADDAAAR
ncbi:MAG: alpha/beta fold hydrolase BchO [Pseudomonadota bacterium]